jgi:hypothetical protein
MLFGLLYQLAIFLIMSIMCTSFSDLSKKKRKGDAHELSSPRSVPKR